MKFYSKLLKEECISCNTTKIYLAKEINEPQKNSRVFYAVRDTKENNINIYIRYPDSLDALYLTVSEKDFATLETDSYVPEKKLINI